MNKAIIFDRDGTLIHDKGYLRDTDRISFYKTDLALLKYLNTQYQFFIVTNQNGVGEGHLTNNDVETINDFIVKCFQMNAITFSKVYYCNHRENDKCTCRKPQTGFIDLIKEEYHIDPSQSFVIGDHPSDMLFAYNGGLNGIYLLTGHGKKHFSEMKKCKINNYVVKQNLNLALRYVISLNKNFL